VERWDREVDHSVSNKRIWGFIAVDYDRDELVNAVVWDTKDKLQTTIDKVLVGRWDTETQAPFFLKEHNQSGNPETRN